MDPFLGILHRCLEERGDLAVLTSLEDPPLLDVGIESKAFSVSDLKEFRYENTLSFYAGKQGASSTTSFLLRNWSTFGFFFWLGR